MPMEQKISTTETQSIKCGRIELVDCKRLYFVVFLLGIIVISIRNSAMLADNILFTEDSTWSTSIWYDGFFHALLNAHDTYTCFGHIILLGIASAINFLFFGKDISQYPFFVSFAQILFYAGFAAAVLPCLKKRLRLSVRLLLSFIILFCSFGNKYDTFEILGRVSNTGYLFYPLCFLLLVYRMDNKNISLYKLVIIDCLIFLCPTSNPVAYPLVVLFFIIDTYGRSKQLKSENISVKTNFKRWFMQLIKPTYMKMWVVLGSALFSVLVLVSSRDIKSNTDGFISTFTNHRELFTKENMVEFLIRQTLYPFVSIVYSRLNSLRSVAILLVFAIVIVFVAIVSTKPERRFLILTLSVSAFYLLVTFLNRSTLFLYLNNYQSVFPHRYHYAQGLMFSFVVGCCLTNISNLSLRRKPMAKTKAYGGKHLVTMVIFLIAMTPIIQFKNLFYLPGSGY